MMKQIEASLDLSIIKNCSEHKTGSSLKRQTLIELKMMMIYDLIERRRSAITHTEGHVYSHTDIHAPSHPSVQNRNKSKSNLVGVNTYRIYIVQHVRYLHATS